MRFRQKKRLALLTVIVLLTGCQPKPGSESWFSSTSARDIAQYYTLICRQYGFEQNTTEMAQCIQKEINAQKQRNTIKQNAVRQADTTFRTGTQGSGITIVLRETFN